MKKDKYVLSACSLAFLVNFVLFLIKLYIGLKSNSISIYSDAVNNMFDSLSGALSLISLSLIYKNASYYLENTVKKTEQLLSFLMALIISFAGFYFFYTSLERLMYPTPVWYTRLYAFVLSGTAAVKILLYFVYRALSKKSDSPIIKVMLTDCILDFFITVVTIITLVVSNYGIYSIDAIFGIIISIIIIVSAIKMVIQNGLKIVNYISTDDRADIDEILSSYSETLSVQNIYFESSGDVKTAVIKAEVKDNNIIKDIKNKCFEKTGINIDFIIDMEDPT